MKRTAKYFSAGLSALMLISGMSAAVSAAGECSSPELVGVTVNCDFADCGNIQSMINSICADGSCNMNSVIDYLKNSGSCPGGICDEPAISVQPQTAPDVPEVHQTEEKQQQPAAVPTETASESEFNTSYEDEVIRLVNEERAKYGLSPLQKDEGAVKVAHLRAKEIVQSFSHTRPDGSSCFTAAKQLGVTYSTAGENIAYGYADPAQVVNGWMNSEGHRKNILSSSFTKIGTGCYRSGNVLYWSQFFIG